MAVRTWEQLRSAFANNNTGDITAADMRDFVDTVEASLNAIEENDRRRIDVIVSNTGDVVNVAGRLPITATVESAGRFTLTCPVGWVWHSAVGNGNHSTALRSVTTNGAGTRELNVSVFNDNGNLQTVSFYLTGVLRPA